MFPEAEFPDLLDPETRRESLPEPKVLGGFPGVPIFMSVTCLLKRRERQGSLP